MHKAYVSIQTPDFDRCRLLKQFLLLLKNNDFQIRKSSDFYLIQDKNKNFYHNQALIINTNLNLQEFQKVLISMAEFVCKKITDHFEIEIVSKTWSKRDNFTFLFKFPNKILHHW